MNFKIVDFFSKLVSPSFSSVMERKVYESLIDRVFYKSLLSIWTSLGVGVLVYVGLLFYKHDWKIHLWIGFFSAIYLSRLLIYYLFFKSDYLSDKIKQKRYSSFQI